MYKRVCFICLTCLSLLLGSSLALAAKDTLVVGVSFNAKTLDPQALTDSGSYNIATQIYESLLTVDADQNLLPLLAERWEVLEGGKAFKFYLKKGVKFHNGETMTADDVVFTFQRATGPEGAAVRALSMYLDPDGIEKVDDYTVILRTKAVMGSAFLASLTHIWSGIFNKKATLALGKDYSMNPVGTGRFKLSKWISGDRIELDRFEDYHGVKAPLKKQIFRTLVEAASRTIELESGAVDIIIDPAPVDVQRIKDNPNLAIISKPSMRLYYLSFEVTKPPYDDVRVREAMNIVVDRPGIVRAVFKDYAEPSNGVTSSAIKYSRYKESPQFPLDIDRAKTLLKEAGYPNGFKGIIHVPDRTEIISIATILQENYMKIGVDMEIKVHEWGVFSADIMREPKHEPFINSWWGGAPAPDSFFLMTPAFHSAVIGQTNRSFLQNHEVDTLLDKGAALNDGPERAEIYRQVWDRLNKLLPWVPLATPDNMFGIQKNVAGVNFSSGSVNYFGTAYFK